MTSYHDLTLLKCSIYLKSQRLNSTALPTRDSQNFPSAYPRKVPTVSYFLLPSTDITDTGVFSIHWISTLITLYIGFVSCQSGDFFITY